MATGHSTKLIPLLEKKDKTYVFTVDVTRTSDSLDLGMPTTILSEREIHTLQDKWNPEEISSICQDFIGTIEQTPPIYSAIRLEGKRAYDLARK